MAVNVLLVSNDLDFQELLNDILQITFKKVKIDKALDDEKMTECLKNGAVQYKVVVMDSHFTDASGRQGLVLINQRFPAMLSRVVVILDGTEHLTEIKAFSQVPLIEKPFSLDLFSETVLKVCNG
jgi:DNA-binding NtrC family response regulator